MTDGWPVTGGCHTFQFHLIAGSASKQLVYSREYCWNVDGWSKTDVI